MSSTIGVMFQVAGETLFPATWNDRQPFLNLHLISSSTPPAAAATYPYPWTEVTNPSYQAQSIPADSVTVTSDSLGSYGVIGETQWPFAAYSGPAVTVNGWWIDDRRTPTPTPLWGGPLHPPYPIPHAGGMLTIDSITLTLRDCAIPPSPFIPQIVWADMFVDHTPTNIRLHKPWVGTSYAELQGHFGIDGPAAICTTGNQFDTMTWDDGTTVFRIDVDIVSSWSGAGGYSVGIVAFRLVDLNNLFIAYVDLGTSQVSLRKIVGGVATVITETAVLIRNLDCFHLSIFEDGFGGISISFDFHNVVNALDFDLLGNTKKGFVYAMNAGTSTVFWMNLLVTTPQNFL